MSLPTKVRLELFQAKHAREMEMNGQTAVETMHVPDLDRALKLFEYGGPSFTGRVGGRIVGCGGLVLFSYPGVAEAWAMVSPHASLYAISWHKTFQFMMKKFIAEYDLRRIQCEVQKDFTRGTRWIEALGFHAEGEMPRFGPGGETFVRYAYLPEALGS